jgi:hypothetical protein
LREIEEQTDAIVSHGLWQSAESIDTRVVQAVVSCWEAWGFESAVELQKKYV